jgi:hypothetical protein
MKKYFMLLLLILYGCDYTIKEYHLTYQDAIKSDLFNRGWLPDILPKSAAHIRISNDLELSLSAGSFLLEEKDIQTFFSKLTKSKKNINSFIYISNDCVWSFLIDDKNKCLIRYAMFMQKYSKYEDW